MLAAMLLELPLQLVLLEPPLQLVLVEAPLQLAQFLLETQEKLYVTLMEEEEVVELTSMMLKLVPRQAVQPANGNVQVEVLAAELWEKA